MNEVLTYIRKPFHENFAYEFRREIDSTSEVYVKVGENIRPETILSSKWKRSGFRTFLLSDLFKLPPEKCTGLLQRTIGSRVYQGDIIAKKSEWLNFRERTFRSPLTGIFVDYDEATTRITLQYLPEEMKIVAGVFGKVVSVIPDKSISIGTLVDGIYGLVAFGTDREGSLLEVGYSDIPLQADQINERCRGRVIFGGTKVSIDVLYKALSVGVAAIVTGGIDYQDYLSLRGSKGRFEDIGISVLATEGFTVAPIFPKIYQKLKEAEHRHVFLDSENRNLIVPHPYSSFAETKIDELLSNSTPWSSRGFGIVKEGMHARLLTGKYLGEYGIVTAVVNDQVEVELAKTKIEVPINQVEGILLA